MSTPALNPLVEKIRGKYPGAYDDMDDAALTKAILAKYPQYSDLAAPPMAKPSVKMDTGEGPIAAGMTSFETQLSKVPAATGQFLKSAAQGFPEDTAAHNRVLAGQADPVDELKNALQKLNPIVSNSEGIDYGATAANLLPVLLGLKKGNISEAASTIKSGAESVLEHPVTKAVVKTADVASFERFSKAYEAYQTWKNLPAEIRAKTNPPTYPGAPLPETPPAEVLQASSLARGPQPVADPAAGLGQIPARYTPPPPPTYPGASLPEAPPAEVGMAKGLGAGGRAAAPEPAAALSGIPLRQEPVPPPPTKIPEPMGKTAAGDTIPRTLSGESALRQVLTGQDNVNLLKIAKSRGINVTQESQLKPGVADSRLINKIIDDFSEDELSNLRDTYLESTRIAGHKFGDIGSEAWKTMSLKTYFPDVKIPAAMLKRVQGAIDTKAPVPDEDLTEILQKSVRKANQASAQ